MKRVSLVGYKNPPENTRFKPGQSGNAKGRPRGSTNVQTIVQRAARERVQVTVNGRKKSITKLEAMVTQLVNKGAAGDLKSTESILRLLGTAVQAQPGDAPTPSDVTTTRSIMQVLAQRMRDAEPTEDEKERVDGPPKPEPE